VKVVVDTNVLVSGIFFGGVPGRVVDAWVAGQLELVLSPEILDEYRRVGRELATKYPERAVALAPVLALITINATLVDAAPLAEPVSVDPADDMFLAAALSSGARLIVSGDRHLLDVAGWRGIVVLTPRAFSDQHLRAR
jgi:putative PIN family toxin of toxin-antitoxin system